MVSQPSRVTSQLTDCPGGHVRAGQRQRPSRHSCPSPQHCPSQTIPDAQTHCPSWQTSRKPQHCVPPQHWSGSQQSVPQGTPPFGHSSCPKAPRPPGKVATRTLKSEPPSHINTLRREIVPLARPRANSSKEWSRRGSTLFWSSVGI